MPLNRPAPIAWEYPITDEQVHRVAHKLLKVKTHGLDVEPERVAAKATELMPRIFISADRRSVRAQSSAGGFYPAVVDPVHMLTDHAANELELEERGVKPKTMAEVQEALRKQVPYARP